MEGFLRTVWADVKQRKNLELYILLLVTIIILTADVIGISSDSVLFEIVLAALAVIIYGMIEDRHVNERLENQLDALTKLRNASDFLGEWDDALFSESLEGANEIWNVASANYEFLHNHSERLKSFLQKGGKLRLILVNPQSSDAKLVVKNDAGTHLQLRIRLSMQEIKALMKFAVDSSHMQVKLINHLPAAVITIVNPTELNSRMFVTLNGFKIGGALRPSFMLTKRGDQKWFDFYLTSFKNIWDWENSHILNLDEINSLSIVETDNQIA